MVANTATVAVTVAAPMDNNPTVEADTVTVVVAVEAVNNTLRAAAVATTAVGAPVARPLPEASEAKEPM